MTVIADSTPRVRVALVAILAVVLLPSVASASTVTRSGGLITVQAAPGETNDVEVLPNDFYSLVDVYDRGPAGITAGDGCTQVAADQARCGATDGPKVLVNLGDGNDTMRAGNRTNVGPFEIHGGPGDDTIHGSPLNDVLYGDEGNDTIDGGQGDDQLFGGAGNDNLNGADGSDTIDGGPGTDVITGDSSNAFSSAGNDTINARDGERDTITCGDGADTVVADRIDVLESGGACESVDVGASGPGPGPGPARLTLSTNASTSGTLGRLAGGGYAFQLTVSSACTASAKLVVTASSARRSGLGRTAVTLVSTSAAIPRAGTFQASLTAVNKYRKKLRKLTKLAARLSLACTAGGQTAKASRDITFRR